MNKLSNHNVWLYVANYVQVLIFHYAFFNLFLTYKFLGTFLNLRSHNFYQQHVYIFYQPERLYPVKLINTYRLLKCCYKGVSYPLVHNYCRSLRGAKLNATPLVSYELVSYLLPNYV